MNEKREKLKPKPMANSVAATFCDEIPNMMSINNIFDIMPPKPSSSISSFGAGFMDLLAVHDYNPFLFDSIATTTNQIQNYHNLLPSPVADGSEVLNTPVSPNSTSISSSLNEAATAIISTNNELLSIKAEDEEDSDRGRGDNPDQQHKTKNQLKQKKKKQRVAIFAFMTKSEVDQLDDGYRWRKYGQKAVKNSPYPRSYYRCTTVGCGVKKRVERSSEDSTIVVTTYEGQHIHPCPATTRASLGFMQYANNSGVLASHPHHFVLPYQFHQALLHDSTITTLPLNSTTEFVNASDFFQDQENHHHQGFVASRTTCLRDNGLLQDIVPTQMRKEKKEEHE